VQGKAREKRFVQLSKTKNPFMRKSLRFSAVWLTAFLLTITTAFAQSVTITGSVKNATSQEGVQSVSVTVKGGAQGTFTDADGNFRITVPKLPVTLVISSIGFDQQEVTVNDASAVSVSLTPASTLGQEVVISATRTPQRILESPVSIERVSVAAIRNAPAANYYDVVRNLKGVDVVSSSLTFATPTTRGFSGSGNARFTQIVDGMDNQAPGLNFSVGSVIGLTELDVESMELLPGASSALYGPGGINGTLLINSKNPFRYQGLSFQIKQGIMHINSRDRDVSPYYNWSLRWGKKVSEKFAFKVGGELIHARDWLADDYRNYRRFGTSGFITNGTRETDPSYDGVNVYGDETSDPRVPTFRQILGNVAANVPFLANYINNTVIPGIPLDQKVSRTGYTENEVTNPFTINFKVTGALHYKITPGIEAVVAGFWGTGNTVYTGSQRYSLKDLKVGQYKVELNAKNWFLRGYTTQENSGESHNLTVTTALFNEAWKPSSTWYQQYAFGFLNAKQAGRSDIDAHNAARAIADQGRPVAGSQQFRQLFDQVRLVPIPQGGLFLDRSDLYMVEGQYNFSDQIKFAEVLVGGNWKQYVLNSQGTLFADEVGQPIKINEYGGYIQIAREIIKDRLKLSASGRYDKNENFDGRFTPRVTALLKPAKDHNIRLSFQTAYRFPTTQQQWIDLFAGTGTLLGSNRALWDKYNMINNPVFPITNGVIGTQAIPYQNVKPESVTSYEVGYKALIGKKLLIDLYGYYGQYQDFLTRRDVIQPVPNPGQTAPAGYSIVVNSPEKVKTYGFGVSAEYQLPRNFFVSGNLSSDTLSDVPAGFRPFFNTPRYRTVLSVGNTGFGPNNVLGFNVSWRWQKGFFYENDFIQGDVPAFHNVDAAFTVRLPKSKSMFKLGATNLLNSYYRTAVGNPSIGGLYYASFAYNVL
jgi:outer membrane receptor protein involved in Fe transport